MAPVFRRRIDPDLTPEQREERIAELRARRKARLRWLAIRSGIASLVLALVLMFAAYWLLMTFGGRDFLLSQITARLPAGTTLEWRTAEGPASGPLSLYDVRFVQMSCPDDGDGEPVPYGQCAEHRILVFTAQRVTIDPAILPLAGRLLRLDVLEVENAVLSLPPAVEDDTPFQLPSWPDALPDIGPLPLSLQAKAIRVDDLRVVGADGPLVQVHQVRGGLNAGEGLLELDQVLVDTDRGRFNVNGHYAPRDGYAMDLTGGAVMPAPAGRTRPNFGVVARGDAAHLDLVVTGHAPSRVLATLALRGGEDPDWRLVARTDALDVGLLAGSGEPGTPLAFDIVADGSGGSAELEGTLAYGDFDAVLLPSTLMLEEQVLKLDPLAVELLDGRVTVRGRADFSDSEGPARGRFSVDADGLAWSGAAGAEGAPGPAIIASARLGVAGTLDAWAAIGRADLARDGLAADLELDARGNTERLQLRRLHAATPGGSLEASGALAWAPALGWELDATLDGFDPGYFAPDFSGAVDAELASRGSTRDDGGLEVEVDLADLGGHLRARALDGSGRFAMHGPAAATPGVPAHYEGEVALTVGDSRIDATATIAQGLDVDARFAPLHLSDLLPGASGRLEGSARLEGTRTAPDIEADLAGSDLAWGGYGAERAIIRGRLPWRGAAGQLQVGASGVNAGVALDSVSARANGTVESMQAEASVRGDIGELDLAAALGLRQQRLQGTLQSLRLAPSRGASWNLLSPGSFAQTASGWQVSQSCFASTVGGALCLEADWPRTGLSVSGTGLPLALAEPWLPERDDGGAWALRGELDIDGQLRPAGGAFAGHLDARSADGGLRLGRRARRDVLGYSGLALEAQFSPQAIQASFTTALDESGSVRAQLETGWDAYSPLAGSIDVDINELVWLELFSPDIVEPEGRLAAQITLGGTRAEPALGGQARLSGFTSELPALGILLEDGDVRLDARGDGTATIDGSVRSGEGTLTIDGSLGWGGDASAPLELRIGGEEVLVSNTRDLHAVASPELTVLYAAGRPLEVTGNVFVPEARMDLERLSDGGVAPSSDVVVLDPVDPDEGPPLAMQLDLTLEMGEDVVLNGFGLEGTLGGRLRVRQYPGRDMRGTGSLQVGGRYEAYGQELRITRGNLSWSNDMIGDPVLDIRAVRRIEAEDLTAGIDVTGRASSPQASVWTDPSRDESEALAYLALGRSLSSVTGDEGRELDAAAAALQAGGGILASQLGAGLGLDEAGVSHSRALGGSVIGVGKQLSPRLYVGFGVSLLGTGQVLTLRYLLTRGFDLEIESSTLENRGSVNWRRETD
ncbi:translocation/assembly module TamB domain-containing protein [Luteimonas dalianensis]|uniref:translocation/assembly module TamB domain-containing protein n=1 Tax=Luteimonas dalianensis TaxID=1148196 RepID=UPI003BF35A86